MIGWKRPKKKTKRAIGGGGGSDDDSAGKATRPAQRSGERRKTVAKVSQTYRSARENIDCASNLQRPFERAADINQRGSQPNFGTRALPAHALPARGVDDKSPNRRVALVPSPALCSQFRTNVVRGVNASSCPRHFVRTRDSWLITL